MHSILSLTDTQYVQDVSASEEFFSLHLIDISKKNSKILTKTIVSTIH